MLITYTPADGDKREWEFKPAKLISAEAEAIEDATGWTFDEFGEKFLGGSMKAKRAALWILLRRETPTLRFRELSITPEEVVVDLEPDEAERLRAAIEGDEDLDPRQRDAILGMLEREAAGAPGKETSNPGDATG